jgi:hypothetical protein
MFKAKLFVAIRVRLIGLIETIEGIGTIIFGTKMPGITLKVMFWELQSAPWKDWEREKVFAILNPPARKENDEQSV